MKPDGWNVEEEPVVSGTRIEWRGELVGGSALPYGRDVRKEVRERVHPGTAAQGGP